MSVHKESLDDELSRLTSHVSHVSPGSGLDIETLPFLWAFLLRAHQDTKWGEKKGIRWGLMGGWYNCRLEVVVASLGVRS